MNRPESADDLSESQLRAIRVLYVHGPMTAASFAARMWPRGKMHWRSHKKGNNGASRGGSVGWVAGGYLGRLRKADLVRDRWLKRRGLREFEETEHARELLREAADGDELRPHDWGVRASPFDYTRDEVFESDEKW